MPNATIKKWAKDAKVTEAKAEKAWEDAKKSADKKFKEKDGDYWSYVNTTTRHKLGLETKTREKELKAKKDKKAAKKK